MFQIDFNSDKFNPIVDPSKIQISKMCSTKDIQGIIESYYRYYQIDMWNNFLRSIKPDYADPYHAMTLPASTGAGKTEIFKFMIPYMLAKAEEEGNKQGQVFGLICHRLCLIQDLSTRVFPILYNKFNGVPTSKEEIKKYLKSKYGCGISKAKLKVYIVNSSNKKLYNDTINHNKKDDIETDSESIDAMNNIQDINVSIKHVKENDIISLYNEINENRKNGIHSFFICLYQSVSHYCEKLKAMNFDFLICDEIHELNYMGQTVFNNNVEVFKSANHKWYFSASIQVDKTDTRYKNRAAVLIDPK